VFASSWSSLRSDLPGANVGDHLRQGDDAALDRPLSCGNSTSSEPTWRGEVAGVALVLVGEAAVQPRLSKARRTTSYRVRRGSIGSQFMCPWLTSSCTGLLRRVFSRVMRKNGCLFLIAH
jgi:hypothetical protein